MTAGCARTGTEDLQEMTDAWRVRAGVPAVVVGVQEAGGDRRFVASGTTQRDGHTPVTMTAPFRVASITKMFVAVVVMQLAEEGRLALDDPVSTFVADVPWDGVTVRQLLNHTSGVPDYSMAEGFGRDLLEDRDRRWSTDDVLALVTDVRPDFPPGTAHRYSNTNYVLLGEVIRAVTGSTWAHEVRRRILDPLALADTFVAGTEGVPEPVVPAYFDADNDGDQENVETGEPWPALETSEGPAGAIVSTAPDMVTFGDALFRGDLVSPQTLAEMVRESPFSTRTGSYGLGVQTWRPDYRTVTWGHGGFLPGFTTVLGYVPSRDAVLVVLANDSLANPLDLAELVMRRLPRSTLRSPRAQGEDDRERSSTTAPPRSLRLLPAGTPGGA